MTDPLFARFGRDFAAGDVLFHEGELGEEMYVVQSGLVQITKLVGTDARPIATLGRGDFLGEMAILNGKPRTASAVVLEDARCLVIDAPTLATMISKNTEIAMRLIKRLAARLDSADAMVQILMHPDPQARILLGLRRRIQTHGEETPDGFRIRVSPEELANEVGTRPEQAIDVLVRLRRLRIAHDGGDAAIVVDLERMLEFLEFLDMPRKFEAS